MKYYNIIYVFLDNSHKILIYVYSANNQCFGIF